MKISIFILLLALLIFTSPHKGCIHDQITKHAKLTPIDDRIHGRVMQANGYGPIRIYYLYNTTDVVSTDLIGSNILKIMDIINLYWQKVIQVYYKPYLSYNVDSSADKNNIQCLTFNVPINVINNPIANKDYGVLIEAKNDGDSGVTAYSYPCAYSLSTNQPIWGLLHWNTNYFNYDLISYQENLIIGIHQMTHLFGFSSILYGYYKNGKVVNNAKGEYINGTYMQAALKKQYACTTAPGMLLESNGGQGTAGSHWSYKLAYNEYMTAGVLINNPTISFITLALLEETGFYKSIWKGYGKNINFGYRKGCGIIDPFNCTSDQYCSTSKLNVKTCDYDQTALGYCKNESLTPCLFLKFYINYICIDPNYASKSLNANITSSTGEKGGSLSRCFDSNFYINGGQPSKFPFRCYETICSSTSKTLTVRVGNQFVLCLFPRQNVTLSGYQGSLTCPKSFAKICAVKRCRSECNANGICLNGKCLCSPSYSGEDCSNPVSIGLASLAGQLISNQNNNCLIGTYLTEFGDCEPCSAGCLTCLSLSQCTQCMGRKNMRMGKCI